MLEIRKTAKAENDLIEIFIYTLTTWGRAQADKYHDELQHGIAGLGHNPKLGQPCNEVRKDYRRLPINRHTVYYQIYADHLMIMRVLHGSMDVKKNF